MKRIFIILFILIIYTMTNISAQENTNTFEYFPIRFDKIYVYTSILKPNFKRNTSYLMVRDEIYQLNVDFINDRVILRTFFRIIIENDKIRLIKKSIGRDETLMIKNPRINSKWASTILKNSSGHIKSSNVVVGYQDIRIGYETFNDCLKVKQIKKVYSKKFKTNLTTYTYYFFAKNIGLVKSSIYYSQGIDMGKAVNLKKPIVWYLSRILNKNF